MKSQNLDKSDLLGNWELNWSEGGFFPKENLLFQRTDKSGLEYIFAFNEDGTIKHEIGPDVECPVGSLTLTEGNWKLENSVLTLELKGLKIADFWYWWIVEYKPTKEKGNLNLEVIRVIKNREIEPTKTWADLISG